MTDLAQSTAEQFNAVESLILQESEKSEPYITTGTYTPADGARIGSRGVWIPSVWKPDAEVGGYKEVQKEHSVFLSGELTSGDVANPEFVPDAVTASTTRGSARYVTRAGIDGAHTSKVTRRLRDGSEQTRTLKRYAASLFITELAIKEAKAILASMPSLPKI